MGGALFKHERRDPHADHFTWKSQRGFRRSRAEAEDGYCQLCTRYGGRYGGYSTEDAWVLPVQGPGDAAGTAVGIRGGISGEFEFHGPFPDIEAARTWASHFGGQAMKLHAPVRSKAA
jgi:hypothetical protein